MFYKICCSILWFVTRIAFRFKVVGKENIPTDIGFILCSNHISAYDPIFIAIDLKKQVHYMAKEELFENPFFRFFGNGVGAFSVKRGAGDANALQTAIDYVKKGEVLGIFPEGTRSKDGKPLRPKSGAAYVAKETGAAVLPVTVCCEGGKVKMFRKVTVVSVSYTHLAGFFFNEQFDDRLAISVELAVLGEKGAFLSCDEPGEGKGGGAFT